MHTEYICLAIMGIFSLLAFFPSSVGKVGVVGMGWAASNRDRPITKELPLWAGRAERAHINLKDNLPGFIIAVLLLGITNHFSDATALACIIYVVARLGHMLTYIAGWALPRTVAFFAGIGSNIFLFCCLV